MIKVQSTENKEAKMPMPVTKIIKTTEIRKILIKIMIRMTINNSNPIKI